MAVPKVKLSLQPIPKSLVRVSVAGEFFKNMGLDNDDDIRRVQQAVAEGLVSELMVLGINAANVAKERFILRFDPLGQDDTIHLDLSDGKSTTEALDTGFASAVAYSVQLMKRRGLSPRFYIIWSAQARANPQEHTSACRRLNLTMDAGPLPPFMPGGDPLFDDPQPAPPAASSYNPPQPSSSGRTAWHASPPPPPANHFFKRLFTIRPAKDPGITYAIEAAIRKK